MKKNEVSPLMYCKWLIYFFHSQLSHLLSDLKFQVFFKTRKYYKVQQITNKATYRF